MKRLQIAQYIALVATALSVIGLLMVFKFDIKFGEYVAVLGVLTGLVSYVFGGFFTAIRMALGIAMWGLSLLPLPWNIIAFMAGGLYSLVAFVFLPIIPVRKAYKEGMRNAII